MASSLEDCIFDLDNLLQQSPKPVINDSKIRNSALIVKKKTIATDILIKKYYAMKEKFDQTIKNLMTSKEECKQVCIDYNSALEKCTNLEKEVQILSIKNQELEVQINISQNQCKAIQSHTDQLQLLVCENELLIESIKLEKQLEKSDAKEKIKRPASQKNELKTLINDICLLRDIVLGKKKVLRRHKIILKKYEKFKPNLDVGDDGCSSDCSVAEMDDFDCSLPPSISLHIKTDQDNKHSLTYSSNKMEKNINNDVLSGKRIDGDHDSDSGNEIISEDTGRGSSLACSDIEKCLNSPDYFINDSPFSNTTQKEKKIYTDTATSPITVQVKLAEIPTSPIAFMDMTYKDNLDHQISTRDIGITADIKNFVESKSVGTSPMRNKQVEIATSPIVFTNSLCKDNVVNDRITTHDIGITADPSDFIISNSIGTSPISNIQQETENRDVDNLCARSTTKTTPEHERRYLEINNSITLNDNHTYDSEVETILNNMRLDHELITPISKSPAKPQNTEVVQTIGGFTCQDAAKVCEDTKNLKNTIDDLKKEITNIKYVLKKNLLLNDDEIQTSNNHISDSSISLTEPCENIHVNNNPIEDVSYTKVCKQMPVNNNHQIIPGIKNSLKFDKTRNNVESINQSGNKLCTDEIINKNTIEKAKKGIKLTRLEKLRKKLLPKCKIRRAMTPPISNIRRRKQLLNNKKIMEISSKSVLDNKIVYENAVKVMAELKTKEKNKAEKLPIITGFKKSKDCKQEIHIVLSKCDKVMPKDTNYGTVLTQVNKSSPNAVTTANDVSRLRKVSSVRTQQTEKTTAICDENPLSPTVSPNLITTRSRSKRLSSELSHNSDTNNKTNILFQPEKNSDISEEVPVGRKRVKRFASDKSETTTKRTLRSSTALHPSKTNDQSRNNCIEKSSHKDCKIIETRRRSRRLSTLQNEAPISKDSANLKLTEIVNYNDLDIFSDKSLPKTSKYRTITSEKLQHPKESILCRMIEKYAKCSVRCTVKKIPDAVTVLISKKLEEGIAKVITVSPHETKYALNDLADQIQKWDMSTFLAAFMKYLKDPARKDELFNKVKAPPAPHMTKSEQVLIYILKQLQSSWPGVNFVEIVLSSIEFALFQLNHTPEFGTVESLSHFYAVLCRYFRAKSRLRLFILDAMYCIQFKAVALIKQCLEVYMHILPLAHLGIAKSPLVTCLVYLLHFFKCEDRFNRVQEIRDILKQKYFYQVTEWTETKMLEMFKNAIKELHDIPIERKMLRMAIIILAKRRGPQWTQKNIVKNILLQFIEKEAVPDRVKEFCVTVLGPLLKPYPNDMKVHCEIVVDQLLAKLDHNASPRMKEAIFTSLLYMRRQIQGRLNQALLAWNPQHVSPELEKLLKDYVREKPAKVWRNTLSRTLVMF